jgi:predicted Rossmann fold flavoprotein
LEVIVIGGGAAGFFGAIACARANPRARVTLLEAGREFLAKVRISGGGRCNVTHACFDPALLVQAYPRGSKALRGAFSRFQPRDTVAWFQTEGVILKTEADGRMFPVSDDSATIVDCLLQAARQVGVDLLTGAAVRSIHANHLDAESLDSDDGSEQRQAPSFQLTLTSGATFNCDRLLLATGGSPQGWRLAKQLGHTIQPPVPSLFTLNCQDPRLQGLAGVSCQQAQVRLLTDAEKPVKSLVQTGPVLITHWGWSGPAILKLSAWGARELHEQRYQGTLIVNWLPDTNPEKLRQQLLSVKAQLPQRLITRNCPVMIPQRLWLRLSQQVGIQDQQRWAELSKQTLNHLIQELVQGRYAITGKGVFKEEFVTCGGVSLAEVDFKTMTSRCCPGLAFAGEVLDIDGITGGFNFQSAWTTGWLAGQALAQAF